MAHPLSIGDTLNEGVLFALKKWASVVKFIWLPIVLMIAMFIGAGAIVLDVSVLASLDETSALSEFRDLFRWPLSVVGLLFFAVYILGSIFYCGAVASIYRFAALGENPPGIFQLRADGPAVRVFLAGIILGLINFAVWLLALGAAFAISGLSLVGIVDVLKEVFSTFETLDTDNGSAVASDSNALVLGLLGAFALAMLIAVVPVIYINVKLTTFLPSAAVENRLALGDSFALTKGQFWQVFGALLLALLVVMGTSIVFQIVSMIVDVIGGVLSIFGGDGGIVFAAIFVIVFMVAGSYFQIFLTGFQTVIPAIIYRRLKTGA